MDITKVVGTIEALSTIVLMFIAVPYKYFGGDEVLVQIMGPIHGALFTGYVALLYLGVGKRWNFRGFTQGFITAIVPFGPFWWDRRLAAGEYELQSAE